MTVRRKSLLSVLLIAIAVGAALSVFRAHNNRAETIIEGEPLSAWVEQLGSQMLNAPDHDRAYQVLSKQPPKIIPELLQYHAHLRIGERVEIRFAKLRRKIGAVDEPFHRGTIRAELLRIISEIAKRNGLAFERRPELQDSVNELTRQLRADPNLSNALIYFWTISQFGANATNALPTLMKFGPTTFTATNFANAVTLRAMADIGPGPYTPEVIRAATNLLSSVVPNDIETALHVLGACGTNASPFALLIAERLDYQDDRMVDAAITALAQIQQTSPDLKLRLAERIERGSGPAAVAMLAIDPQEPTALNIVQARLHPLAGRDHTQMIQLVSRIPNVAKLFLPELEKLARKTNAPTASLARQTLRQLAAETNRLRL